MTGIAGCCARAATDHAAVPPSPAMNRRRRCETRAFLEFHHVIPYAMGGEATIENIQLRCRAHNGYEADLYYGPGRPSDDGDVVRETRARYGAQLGPDRVRVRSTRDAPAPA